MVLQYREGFLFKIVFTAEGRKMIKRGYSFSASLWYARTHTLTH